MGKNFPLSPAPLGYSFDGPSPRPLRQPPNIHQRNMDLGAVNNEGAPMIGIEKSCSRLIIRNSLVFALFAAQFSRHGDRELQGRLRALCGEIPSSRCSCKKITWRTWRTLDKCGNRNQLRFCTNLADPISDLAEPAKTAAIFPLLKIRVYPCDPRFSRLRPGLVATAARAGSSVDVSEE